MSTATLTAPVRDRDARPGLVRLTVVELRKMTDTRSGFWLLLTTALLTAAAVVLFAIFGESNEHTLTDFFGLALAAPSILMPITGILLVTSEWSQRTAVLTFALVPERSRVLWAKLAASVVLSVAALQIALAVAVVGTAVVGGDWTLPPWMLGQSAISVATGDDLRRRVRRDAARPGARDRPVLRASGGLERAQLVRVPRGRRALARRLALAQPADRGADEHDAVGARGHDARRLDAAAAADRALADHPRRRPLAGAGGAAAVE